MNYNKYPKYKHSGIKWIGEIPEHWEIIKLKYVLDSLESGNREIGGGGIADGIFSIGGEHIGWFGELILDNPKFISEDYYNNLNKGKIKKNDVLLVKDGATIGKCALISKMPFSECAVNEHVFILRVNQKFSAKYLFYLVWCRVGQEQILMNIRGSAQPGLNSYFINDVIIPIPPLPEQTAIANFLDDKTAKIDSLIEKKKKLIELYKEERTAVINQAVTRGINPNVKLKPSGIDWLGDIPAHWEVKKLKYVAKLKSGESITSDKITDEGQYPVYGGNGLRGYTSNYTHEGDYILIGRQGALCGNVNYARGKFFASEHAVVVTISNFVELIWLGEILRAMNLNKFSVSAAQPGLSVERIQNLFIPIPPLEEQQQIVEYIESEMKRIDEKIARTEKEIELLQEYRTALISEVVTGKIKIIDKV